MQIVATKVYLRRVTKLLTAHGLNLSQRQFADRFGLASSTVRDWEQGRRRPDRCARILLRVIERDDEAVVRALA